MFRNVLFFVYSQGALKQYMIVLLFAFRKKARQEFYSDVINDNINRLHISVYHFVVIEKKEV